MMEVPQILITVAQPYASLHLTVPSNEMQKVMGPGLREVRSALAEQGAVAAGPWFTHHFRMQPAVFDFEICVPVAAPIAAVGEVRPGVWSVMRVARTVYPGGYEGLGGAWSEFGAWIASQGFEQAPDLWERYLVGPEASPSPADWRTELTRPLL